jgi:VWFA-related protein
MTESSRRPTTTLALVAALALAGGVAAGPRDAAQKPSFPAETEIVTVDVVVLSRAGEAVPNLRREDFAVSEDGVRQEIVAFEAVHRPAALPGATAGAPAGATREPALRASTNRGTPGQEPATFVIVFDELHLGPAEAVRARRAVAQFLETGVADGDRLGLVGTDEGTRWTSRMPDGREALLRALARLQGKRVGEMVRDAMTEYEAMRIDQDRDPIVTDQVMRRLLTTGEIRRDVAIPLRPGDVNEPPDYDLWRSQTRSLAAQVYARASVRAEQALGVMQRSLESLREARGRKSLVLVSAGLVQDPRLAGYRRVVTESRRANTAVSFLDVRGLVAAPSSLQADVAMPLDIIDRSTGVGLTETGEGSEGSEGLALDTGGLVLKNQNDLAAGLARIGREARSYYLLGYAPSNRAADGKFRRIEVKAAREGVRVRARRGYFAPGRDDEGGGVEGRDAALQRALDAPFDLPEVPLRAIAQVFGEAVPGQASVLLTAEADIRGLAFTEKDGVSRDTLELLLLVARRDTGEFKRFDQQFEMGFQKGTRARFEETWFPITRELRLDPGPYQAKIVTRDRNSGRLGSLTHDFEVPAPAGLRVSSLVLSDRLREEAKGGGPEIVARRRFASAGTLHCRFEIYGASKDPATGQPRVTAGFAVRRTDGRVLVAAPETPVRPGAGGSLTRSLGFPLDGVPPGTYEVIVIATDLVAGGVAEAREPIVVEATPGG